MSFAPKRDSFQPPNKTVARTERRSHAIIPRWRVPSQSRQAALCVKRQPRYSMDFVFDFDGSSECFYAYRNPGTEKFFFAPTFPFDIIITVGTTYVPFSCPFRRPRRDVNQTFARRVRFGNIIFDAFFAAREITAPRFTPE